MGRVEGEIDSIRRQSVLDLVEGTASSVSTGTSTDSSIIKLVAGANITANQLVGLSGGLAVLADYTGVPCIGIALDTVTADNVLRIKIHGVFDIANNTASEYFLGSVGNVRPYSYESNKLLQKVADKINDNQIFINIGKSVLML